MLPSILLYLTPGLWMPGIRVVFPKTVTIFAQDHLDSGRDSLYVSGGILPAIAS